MSTFRNLAGILTDFLRGEPVLDQEQAAGAGAGKTESILWSSVANRSCSGPKGRKLVATPVRAWINVRRIFGAPKVRNGAGPSGLTVVRGP